MSMTPVRFVLFTLSLAVSMAPLRAAQKLSGTGFEAKEDLSVYTIFEVSGQFDEQKSPN